MRRRGRRRAARALPRAGRPARRRHLLRHAEPAGGRRAPWPRECDLHARRRLAQLVQLATGSSRWPNGRAVTARLVEDAAELDLLARRRAARSGSPPAPRHPTLWSRGSSTPSPASVPSTVRRARRVTRGRALHPSRGGALMAIPLRQKLRVGPYLRAAEARAARAVSAHRRARAALRVQPRVRRAAARSSTPPRSSRRGSASSDAVGAMEECGAPMVSIAGGEPLLHPDIEEMVRQLIDRKRSCTCAPTRC